MKNGRKLLLNLPFDDKFFKSLIFKEKIGFLNRIQVIESTLLINH